VDGIEVERKLRVTWVENRDMHDPHPMHAPNASKLGPDAHPRHGPDRRRRRRAARLRQGSGQGRRCRFGYVGPPSLSPLLTSFLPVPLSTPPSPFPPSFFPFPFPFRPLNPSPHLPYPSTVSSHPIPSPPSPPLPPPLRFTTAAKSAIN